MADEIEKKPAVHDIGGRSLPGTIDFTPHLMTDFEKNVDALVNLLANPNINLVCPDERRRGIESLPEHLYFSIGYYQRWLMGIKMIMVEKGVMSEMEVANRMAQLRKKAAEV